MRVSLLALVCMALAGCDRPAVDKAATPPPPPPAAHALQVLATTDLRDIEPLQQMVLKATGVNLQFRFGGTMESTEAVLNGQSGADLAWFANAKYLLSDAQGQSRVKLQEKIMLSPIALGLSESTARELGWDRPDRAAKVTWKDIAAAAKAGKLSYALSNPATSNQGFMALLGVVASASQKADGLVAADVDRSAIAAFLKGYRLPGDNSTYLSEKFIERQGVDVNAFINYESWLLGLNQSGKLREKLVLVYPHEGVSTADYPLLLLNDARRDDYLKVVAYLKGETAQTWLARQTLRRPVVPEVAEKVADILPRDAMRIELPFSPDRALADGLIDAYLNEFRRPIASTFVLDTSGSMERDGRQQQLIQALDYIAGVDRSLTGRIARLTNRERLWMQPFSDNPYDLQRFEIPAGTASARGVQVLEDSAAKQKALAQVRAFAAGLNMRGGTALFDAVLKSLKNMADEKQKNPGYQYSVVAFTDGESNKGRSFDEFKRDYDQLPEDARSIPVFMVLFGDANERQLRELVKVTGGRLFDARKTPLYSVFKDIRAYQ
ncbi:VWA domain-containing protein [Rhizobacter sp. SG703]|uniref:vWA domain-containing protein n=1 Tax=Rhizobacter sp. SG703 TaxID=2587140 RepID=UPI001446D597|nr:VWA domain-containing protein [Rhizobacter sp. SG703]NKI96139.1 Ca-activated chloride channel family protein [Rhizobacter sp. SG703]